MLLDEVLLVVGLGIEVWNEGDDVGKVGEFNTGELLGGSGDDGADDGVDDGGLELEGVEELLGSLDEVVVLGKDQVLIVLGGEVVCVRHGWDVGEHGAAEVFEAHDYVLEKVRCV